MVMKNKKSISALIGDKDTFEIVDNEKPGYLYYNKDIDKFRSFLKNEENGEKEFLWRTLFKYEI
jgi:hypothetical protein